MDVPWIASLIAAFIFGWNLDDVLINKSATKRQCHVFGAALVAWLVCVGIGISKHF